MRMLVNMIEGSSNGGCILYSFSGFFSPLMSNFCQELVE